MKRLKTKPKIIQLIMLLMVTCLLLSSCKSGGFFGFGTRNGDAAPRLDYRRGSSGLVLKYLKEITPNEIDEEESFNIGLQVSNEGAADAENIHLILTGYNTNYFSDLNPPKISPFSLDGKSKYNPDGEKKIFSFNLKNKELPEEKYEEIFLSTLCYQYETIASTEVCIVTDTVELTKLIQPPCSPKDSISMGTQGAPVAVTKIEPRFYKENDKLKADFKIYVSNKGKGGIRSTTGYDKECTGSGALTSADINHVNINVRLGNKEICSGTYEIKTRKFGEKDDEPDYYKCSTELKGIQESYLSFIKIELDYGYVETVGTKIRIRKF